MIHPFANAQVVHRPCLSSELYCQRQQHQSRVSYSRNQLLSFRCLGKLSCTPTLLMKLKFTGILRYLGKRSGGLSKARSTRNGLRIPTTSSNRSHYRSFLNQLFNLAQLVHGSTHRNGHTPDLFITSDDEDFVRNLLVFDPALSDHRKIHCDLNFSRHVLEQRTLSYRRLRAINIDKLSSDLENSALINSPLNKDLSTVIDLFNSTLQSTMDHHAPVVRRSVTFRHHAPWSTSA